MHLRTVLLRRWLHQSRRGCWVRKETGYQPITALLARTSQEVAQFRFAVQEREVAAMRCAFCALSATMFFSSPIQRKEVKNIEMHLENKHWRISKTLISEQEGCTRLDITQPALREGVSMFTMQTKEHLLFLAWDLFIGNVPHQPSQEDDGRIREAEKNATFPPESRCRTERMVLFSSSIKMKKWINLWKKDVHGK